MLFRSFVTLLLFAIVATDAFGISARVAGDLVVIHDGKKTIKIRHIVDEYDFYDTIHAVCRMGEDYFLVVGTSSFSRGYPPRGGNCGAGIESAVVWFRIRDGKIIEQQEGLHESCFRNRSTESLGWKEGKLQWSSSGFEQGEKGQFLDCWYSWTFDPLHPEAGINEKKDTKVAPPPTLP